MTASSSKVAVRPWVGVAMLSALFGVLLQIPLIGFYLLLLGIPVLWALSIHAVMLMIAVDCWQRKSSRALLVIPALFYAAGIALCANSIWTAHTLGNDVSAMNRGSLSPYDPSTQVLVFNDSDVPSDLQQRYQADLVYVDHSLAGLEGQSRHPSEIAPGGFLSGRAFPPPFCRQNVHFPGRWVSLITSNGLCTLTMPETPRGRRITILSDKWTEHRGVGDVDFLRATLRTDGMVATRVTARTHIYPPVFFFLNVCALNDATSSMNCYLGPWGYPKQIGVSDTESQPDSALADLIATALGLSPRPMPQRRFAAIDVAPSADQAWAFARAASYHSRRLSEILDDLPDVIANPASPLVTREFSDALRDNPIQTAQRADLILHGMEVVDPHYGFAVREALSVAISRWPPEVIRRHGARILAIAKREQDLEWYGSVSIMTRLGDIGRPALPVLLPELGDDPDDLMHGRFAPIPAAISICRGGAAFATPRVIAALKSAAGRDNGAEDSSFVALLRIGARSDAIALEPSLSPRAHAWRLQQLAQISPSSSPDICTSHSS